MLEGEGEQRDCSIEGIAVVGYTTPGNKQIGGIVERLIRDEGAEKTLWVPSRKYLEQESDFVWSCPASLFYKATQSTETTSILTSTARPFHRTTSPLLMSNAKIPTEPKCAKKNELRDRNHFVLLQVQIRQGAVQRLLGGDHGDMGVFAKQLSCQENCCILVCIRPGKWKK